MHSQGEIYNLSSQHENTKRGDSKCDKKEITQGKCNRIKLTSSSKNVSRNDFSKLASVPTHKSCQKYLKLHIQQFF